MKIHAIISWQVITTILLLGQEDVEMLLSWQRPFEPRLPAALHTAPRSLRTTHHGEEMAWMANLRSPLVYTPPWLCFAKGAFCCMVSQNLSLHKGRKWMGGEGKWDLLSMVSQQKGSSPLCHVIKSMQMLVSAVSAGVCFREGQGAVCWNVQRHLYITTYRWPASNPKNCNACAKGAFCIAWMSQIRKCL